MGNNTYSNNSFDSPDSESFNKKFKKLRNKMSKCKI